MVMEVQIVEPRTVFGEVLTAELEARAQIDAVFGIRSKTDTETFIDDSASGSVTTHENTSTYGREFKCSTGTSSGGYAIFRTKRAVRYKPGQGILGRYTARFETPPVNGTARAGFIGVGCELSFGYNTNQRFGILYRTGGKVEVRTLTLSAGAGGNETLTITLNSVAFNVNVTSGTAAAVASQIAASASTFTGWYVSQNESTVIFQSKVVGPLAGTYSLTAGGGTTAGTYARTITGVDVTDSWYYPEEWNMHPNFPIDPTKGNVFQIRYQYLGYGILQFFIEEKNTGRFVEVHRVKYPNTNTGANLILPILKLAGVAASIGSTTNFSMYVASMAAFIEGHTNFGRNPQAKLNSKSGVTTTLTNILTIRCCNVFNTQINAGEIHPRFVTCGVEGTKPAEFYLVLNAELGGTPNYAYVDSGNSITEFDTAATTVTVGTNSQVVHADGLSKTGDLSLDLEKLRIVLGRFDTLTVAVKATSGTTDVTAGLVWLED